MTGDRSLDSVSEAIEEVWMEHDDFAEGGFPYVAFLIENDIADMRADNWDEPECIEELADVCINAMRMMKERGYDPEEVILDRLDNHESKGTEDLIEDYQTRFESR